ncbi:MAG TPA: hypothetical protein VGU20_31035 [Stellaceae bacterium]|nr:hypothetical protein [Terriglobia bacterium]HEV2551786.1 hypothetical protein [Stellaceae bacterium]
MADELIPPAIRNGGTGAAPTSGSVRGDYRQVQAAEEVNAPGVDRAADTEAEAAAARARALGGLFKEFEGISSDVGIKASTQVGALAGAASGNTGHPQYKQGLAQFTAYGRAFNNAATGAYAIEAEAQADDAAARLRVEANNNPATFAATFSATRDAVLKNAPPMAVPMLTELYNKRLAAGLAAISGDQAAEIKQTQRRIYDIGIQRGISKVATLQGSENPHDQLEGSDEWAKLSLMIHGGVTNGLYSPAEAQAMEVNAHRAITEQVFETQVDRELYRPGGDPVGLIARFRQAHLDNMSNPNEVPILSEDEFNRLMGNAKQKVLQQNMMEAYAKRQGKTEEELRFEAGDKEGTSRLLSSTLTVKWLDSAVRTGDLKPEVARTLRAALLNDATGAPSHSNTEQLFNIMHDPNFLDMDGRALATYPDLSIQDRNTLVREQAKRLASWENTQAVKNGRSLIDFNLKIAPGTSREMLSPEENKARDAAQQEYLRLMSAEDPAKRDSTANQHAIEAVQHVQKQLAVDKIAALTKSRQTFIQNFGPGSPGSMDKEQYETRLKQIADSITAQQAILGQK